MYMSLVSHRVRTFVRVTAASLHMTGIVRINHTEVRSRNHSYRGRAKVLHILCVCVCVCVCVSVALVIERAKRMRRIILSVA